MVLIRDHNGDSTVYVYDGNGNLVPKTEVPSRFMRKIICRLRLNEVSRQ